MAMVFIIMGVSGCGKTAIGQLLGRKLNIPFFDADDYHSPDSIKKMNSGIPLDDRDREPWLICLSNEILKWKEMKGAVLACSALKEKYRMILSRGDTESILFIYLFGKKELIYSRIMKRKNHFMNESLLDSQFDVLEEPENAIKVGIDRTQESIVDSIISELVLRNLVNNKN